ncbi:MAG: FliH/SctL family protein, partial [bacterium]|nr:FliH/SctL family protein [bacterium]
ELKHVTILEDTRIDKGGCIIETDFGSVDARIATQLQEIEEMIRELANLSYFEVPKVVKLKEAEPVKQT